jgi:DNA-binding GntR family transcriptional regulator
MGAYREGTGMELKKVETKTLRALIYEQLRERIMSGEIKPGEDLSFRTLAEKLGVSLMPVREAVWQLESDKILVVKNNRGIRVNALSQADLQEALHIRFILESEAMIRSCKNRDSDAVLPELCALMDAMEAPECDARTFVDFNKQFHFMLYRFANAPLLMDLIERLWVRITPYVYLNITRNEDLTISPANNFHRTIYDCFVRRDSGAAVRALKLDIENPAIQIIKEME